MVAPIGALRQRQTVLGSRAASAAVSGRVLRIDEHQLAIMLDGLLDQGPFGGCDRPISRFCGP